eukprot:s3021_g1.t1
MLPGCCFSAGTQRLSRRNFGFCTDQLEQQRPDKPSDRVLRRAGRAEPYVGFERFAITRSIQEPRPKMASQWKDLEEERSLRRLGTGARCRAQHQGLPIRAVQYVPHLVGRMERRRALPVSRVESARILQFSFPNAPPAGSTFDWQCPAGRYATNSALVGSSVVGLGDQIPLKKIT